MARAAAGVLIRFSSAIYLIANLGPGTRDGFMTGLQKATNLPLAHVLSCIELSIVCAGWFLGVTAGIGTLLFAFGIGPCVAVSIQYRVTLFNEKSQGNLSDKNSKTTKILHKVSSF